MAKRIAWTDQARADVRSLDHPAAIKLLEGLARFLATEQGDVKRLKGIEPPELRLRLGNYRIRFHDYGDTIEVLAVKDRKEAYR